MSPEADGALPPADLPLHLARLSGLSWHGFTFNLPPGWEVTGYSLKPTQGRFQFHDGPRMRGELSWRTVDGTPDLPRIFTEVLRRYLELEAPEVAPGFGTAICGKCGEWMLAWNRPGDPLLAGLWKHDERILLQWFFSSHSPQLLPTISTLLESYRKNEAQPRRWQLFGMGASLPGDFSCSDVEALPAFALLRFENPRNLQVVLRRIGMVEETLGGQSLGHYYRKLLARTQARLLSLEDATFQGHPALHATFERRGEARMDALTGRWWQGEAYIWQDDAEGRIYSCDQWGPNKQPRLELDHVWL